MKQVGIVYESDVSGEVECYAYVNGNFYNLAPRPINKQVAKGMAILIPADATDAVIEAAKDMVLNIDNHTPCGGLHPSGKDILCWAKSGGSCSIKRNSLNVALNALDKLKQVQK